MYHKDNTPCIICVWNSADKKNNYIKGTIINTCTALDRLYRVNVETEGGKRFNECAPECVYPLNEWVDKIKSSYEKNEKNNLHTYNMLMLANYFGDEKEKDEAKDIMKKHLLVGHLTLELLSRRDELSKKLMEVFKIVLEAKK